jgi:hypothetical protein
MYGFSFDEGCVDGFDVGRTIGCAVYTKIKCVDVSHFLCAAFLAFSAGCYHPAENARNATHRHILF